MFLNGFVRGRRGKERVEAELRFGGGRTASRGGRGGRQGRSTDLQQAATVIKRFLVSEPTRAVWTGSGDQKGREEKKKGEQGRKEEKQGKEIGQQQVTKQRLSGLPTNMSDPLATGFF